MKVTFTVKDLKEALDKLPQDFEVICDFGMGKHFITQAVEYLDRKKTVVIC